MGSIGVEGGNYQFAALGEPMNFGARLVGAAKAGELVMSKRGVGGRRGRDHGRAVKIANSRAIASR